MLAAKLLLPLLVYYLVNAKEPTHVQNTTSLKNRTASSDVVAGTIVFGTLWHVYVHTTVYHLLVTDANESSGDLTFFRKGLVAFTSCIPHLAKKVNPCREEQAIAGSIGNIGDLLFHSATSQNSRWCGTVHVAFKPHFAENNHRTRTSVFEWRWLLHANAAFRFNITFLSYEVLTFLQRFSLKLHVVESGINTTANVANEYKPGHRHWSYYSATNTIAVVLSTDNFIPVQSTLASNEKESYQAKFSFQYHIHGNDFSFVRQRDASYNYRPFAGLQRSSAGIFANLELRQIRIHAPWLKTVVLDRAKFACRGTGTNIRIIFYDLPEMELSKTIYKSDRVGEWHCPTNRHKDRGDNIQATIGDLTAWVIAERGTLLSRKHFSLYFHYIDLSASVSTIEQITLQSMGRRAAFIPPRFGKHMHFIHVTAKSFVRVSVQKLSYTGYTSHECRLGGMMLISRYHLRDRICSNMTGEYLTEHFYSQGIAVGQGLVVIVKQYGWLSRITANITLELGLCSGFVNALPYFMYRHKAGIMYDERAGIRVENGRRLSFYYRLSTMYNQDLYILQFYRESSLCYQFQIIFFDIFGSLELPYMANGSTPFLQPAVYYMESHENGFPSRFSIRFSFLRDEIQYSNPCMYDGLRFFPNNRNDEPFIFLDPSSTEAWSTDSHFTTIRAYWLCIQFSAVISIQVEDASKTSACLTELGTYTFWQSAGITTPGTCGFFLIGRHLYPIWGDYITFMLQRPLMYARCCFYEGIISSDNSSCINSVSLLRLTVIHQSSTLVMSGLVWKMKDILDRLIRWRDSCWKNLMGFLNTYCFAMRVILRPMASCTFQFNYRAHFHYHLTEMNTNVMGDTYNKICLDRSCYITAVKSHIMTWHKAQEFCKEEGGNLASINSEREWNFITSQYPDHMPFMNVSDALVFFIGLHSKVSSSLINSCFRRPP